jgi:SAM-dependent methyltransferase
MSPFCCRSCGSSSGRLILDLGVQPLANNLLTADDLAKPEPRFPLRVAVCEACWLLQITDIVPPVELFSEYLYFSSFSDALLRHSAEAVTGHLREFRLGAGSFVVEIASNDGYLLKNFVAAGVPCLGIEPAANIAKVARKRGIETLCQFFGTETAGQLASAGRQADLILGNNVFAHAPDTNDFVAGLARLLKPGGRVALEFPYACDLVEHVEFDTVYHEHVFYFTLTALVPLFARHGLEIFDVRRLPIHGGSLRLYAARPGTHPVTPAVGALLAEERAKGVPSPRYYDDFADRVRRIREDLQNLVRELKAAGKSVAAYGASAKGSTLLNFYGLGADVLDFVADRSTAKQGRLTPGTHLPIVGPEELTRRRPDYALLLTWNFAEEILRQQQAYRDAGGKFIVPLPEVRIV